MTSETKPPGKYAKLKDLELYYEIHGSGQPLVLLPGSFHSIEMMGTLVSQLAATRQVIAVDPMINEFLNAPRDASAASQQPTEAHE